MTRSIIRLAACIALCLGVGLMSGWVTYPAIPTWYADLTKPSWTPPNWAFPVVWNVLYVMMGVSLWLLWDKPGDLAARRSAIVFFFVQLALNAAWSPVFFGLHLTRAALAIIIAMTAATVATIAYAWRARELAGWLLVPYLAWVIYASSLNSGIVMLNPCASAVPGGKRLCEDDEMLTFTYFAYGSNMLRERLSARCPSAKVLGHATASGYSLQFFKKSVDGSGKATLVQSAKDDVLVNGVLFEIVTGERVDLDAAEGLGQGYARDDDFRVRSEDGNEVRATTYIGTRLDRSGASAAAWLDCCDRAGRRCA